MKYVNLYIFTFLLFFCCIFQSLAMDSLEEEIPTVTIHINNKINYPFALGVGAAPFEKDEKWLKRVDAKTGQKIVHETNHKNLGEAVPGKTVTTFSYCFDPNINKTCKRSITLGTIVSGDVYKTISNGHMFSSNYSYPQGYGNYGVHIHEKHQGIIRLGIDFEQTGEKVKSTTWQEKLMPNLKLTITKEVMDGKNYVFYYDLVI